MATAIESHLEYKYALLWTIAFDTGSLALSDDTYTMAQSVESDSGRLDTTSTLVLVDSPTLSTRAHRKRRRPPTPNRFPRSSTIPCHNGQAGPSREVMMRRHSEASNHFQRLVKLLVRHTYRPEQLPAVQSEWTSGASWTAAAAAHDPSAIDATNETVATTHHVQHETRTQTAAYKAGRSASLTCELPQDLVRSCSSLSVRPMIHRLRLQTQPQPQTGPIFMSELAPLPKVPSTTAPTYTCMRRTSTPVGLERLTNPASHRQDPTHVDIVPTSRARQGSTHIDIVPTSRADFVHTSMTDAALSHSPTSARRSSSGCMSVGEPATHMCSPLNPWPLTHSEWMPLSTALDKTVGNPVEHAALGMVKKGFTFGSLDRGALENDQGRLLSSQHAPLLVGWTPTGQLDASNPPCTLPTLAFPCEQVTSPSSFCHPLQTQTPLSYNPAETRIPSRLLQDVGLVHGGGARPKPMQTQPHPLAKWDGKVVLTCQEVQELKQLWESHLEARRWHMMYRVSPLLETDNSPVAHLLFRFQLACVAPPPSMLSVCYEIL